MPMRDRLARLVHRNPNRPSLRERAAALKASAARVLRKDAAARIDRDPAAPVDGADADLLRLALVWLEMHAREQASLERQERIEQRCPVPDVPAVGSPEWEGWHAQATAWRSASGVDDEEAEGRRLAREADRIASEIAAIPARTLPGIQAKARIVQSFADLDSDPIEGLVPGLARDLMALSDGASGARFDWTAAPPAPAASDAELIALGRQFDETHAAWLPLIETSLAAHARVRLFEERARSAGMSAIEANRAAWLQDGVQEAREAEEAASATLDPIIDAIMAAQAHTVAGLAVKARAAILAVWPNGDFEADRSLGRDEDWDKACVRRVIDACTMLAQRQAAGGSPSDGPIEKPGEVGRDGMVLFETIDGDLRRRPIAEWVGHMAQRLYSIASTEASRQFNYRRDGLDEAATEALHAHLQRDLRIDALKDLAFRSQEVFEAAEAKRREGEPSPTKPELPDLSKLSILQLSNLHDQFEQAADFWSAAAHLPWAGETGAMGCRDMNAAGEVLDAESERAGSLRYAVAREIERRVPSADGYEQDMRLAALIRDELLCNGGLRHAPALRAAITERWSA